MAADPIFIGKAHYSGTVQGFAEAYTLKGNNLATCLAAFQALLGIRMNCLNQNIQMVFASITQIGVKRKSHIVYEDIQKGTLTSEGSVPESLNTCFALRQETIIGDVANRYMHGLPDDAIVDHGYTAPSPDVLFDSGFVAYKAALITNTGYLHKVNPTDPTTWTVVPWTTIANRGVTSHKVGRPFDEQAGRRRVA